VLPGMTGTNEAFTAWADDDERQAADPQGDAITSGRAAGDGVPAGDQGVLDAVTPLVNKFADWATALQTMGGPKALAAVQKTSPTSARRW
jgi:hypothetical protein